MSNDLRKNGWQYFSIPEVREAVKKIAAKKDPILTQTSVALSSRVGARFDRFDPAKFEEVLLMKSAVRALLRYDSDMLALAKAIYVHASPRLTEDFGELYCCPPYPYIHLPEDTSESSRMHMDHSSHDGKFFTIWVPLNPCRHQPISIIPRSQAKWSAIRVLGAVERRLGIGELPWFHERVVSPDVELGDFMAWDGRTHHAGNLNRTDWIHSAVNFKLSTHPHALEPSVKQKDFSPDALGNYPGVDTKQFLETYFNACDTLRKADLFNRKENGLLPAVRAMLTLVESLRLDRGTAIRCSYGLTLFCIRRETMQPEVARLNLAATLLSDEYLWSLERFVEFALKHYPAEAVSEALDFLTGRFPSRQTEVTRQALRAKHHLGSPARVAVSASV